MDAREGGDLVKDCCGDTQLKLHSFCLFDLAAAVSRHRDLVGHAGLQQQSKMLKFQLQRGRGEERGGRRRDR